VVVPEVTVFLGDADGAYRVGLGASLEAQGFVVCGEAATAMHSLRGCITTMPRLCVLDVNLPGGAVVAAGEIARALPSAGIVMLAAREDDGDLFGSLAAGAVGYLLKDTPPERIGAALRGVLAGEAALPRALVARLITEFRERILRRRAGMPVPLTTREWQVLELLGQGSTTTEIASQLDVAPVTVRSHVSSLMRKLAVSTREEALALYESPH